jgi:aldose 1-epimerase
MIELVAGEARVVVDPVAGGRVASIEVGGRELLVTGALGDNPMAWGSYPMVPYAGRIRDAHFTFRGREVALPPDMAPHAIHGCGYVTPWDVLDEALDSCELQVGLTWPLGGTAHQHVQLTPQALVCVLTVVAGHEAMPVTIGWHPWFRKPEADELHFESMYVRDAAGIPTGQLAAPAARPWDECFIGPRGRLALHTADGLTVVVASDCDHWVVYDQPLHATCVEPQSGPPDAVHLGSAVELEPGEMLQRTMTISWSSRDAA